MMAAEYRPIQIADRPVDSVDGPSAGSPYVLPIGVVTTYDPTNGLFLQFPTSPQVNDYVEIKNATKSPVSVTLDPGANEVEAPGAGDTDYFIGPSPATISLSAPAAAHRWVFDGGSPGAWMLDNNYQVADDKAKTTLVATDYTLQFNNEIALVDTTAAGVTITVPADWPTDSKFTVSKISLDGNAITIATSGIEKIQVIRLPAQFLGNTSTLLISGESITYVKRGLNWYSTSAELRSYTEIFTLPVTPVALTPGAALLEIALDTNLFSTSRFFSSNTNGLLTLNPVFLTFVMTVSVQVVFDHTIGANNTDVWGQVTVGTSSTDTGNILVPMDAAFAHARAGVFGDTRSADSLVFIQGGQTIGIYGEELESSGGSTSEIMGMVVRFSITG